MAKQLSIYDQLSNPASREVWRKKATSFRQTYKINIHSVKILEGWNTRQVFEGIEELADDIAENGLNEPLEGIMTTGGRFLLTDGERRFKAIQLLRKRGVDFTEVPVIPVPSQLKPQDMLVRMLSSGVHKSIYKDVEVANGLLRLKNDFELSNADIGKKMGKSRQWVDNMIKLAKQPDEVKNDLAAKKITKTAVVAPMKDKVTDVAAGMIKAKPIEGLPPSLKTDNQKAEAATGAGSSSSAPPATNVSGKDALQGVNFDKEVNEQEAAINRIAKMLNKIESLGKGLNDQGKQDLDSYLKFARTDIDALKTYYSKFKNKQVK